MTKLVKKTDNSNTGNPLFFPNKYFIDSAKFYIDSDLFQKVNLPSNFTLIDSDTGEQLDEFKRNSLLIPYKNHKIYIANIKKQLKQGFIDKVLIYFPAKISDNYFFGISKDLMIEVLEFLKSSGRLVFGDSEEIYNQIYVKDLDVKLDFIYSQSRKEEIERFNKILKDCFLHDDKDCHVFNSQKQGFGISTYKRDTGTIKKPFLKFYDKSLEMISKNKEYFHTLSPELQSLIQHNFIYRYEFTLKDRRYFDKFNISNRLVDLHELPQDKWKEIGKYFIEANFYPQIKTPKNLKALTPTELIISNLVFALKEQGLKLIAIKELFLAGHKSRKDKYKANLSFERIVYYVTERNAKEIRENYEFAMYWFTELGFF